MTDRKSALVKGRAAAPHRGGLSDDFRPIFVKSRENPQPFLRDLPQEFVARVRVVHGIPLREAGRGLEGAGGLLSNRAVTAPKLESGAAVEWNETRQPGLFSENGCFHDRLSPSER